MRVCFDGGPASLQAGRAHPARNLDCRRERGHPASCVLPSASCLPPSAHCSLPTAHCTLYYSPVPKESFPDWIVPMAATLTQERFTRPEWSFERKFDGIRLLAYKKGKQVQLFSRNHLPQNLPSISKAIANLPHRELILDGEIDWHAVVGTHASSRAAYHIFDIMWIDGRETMSLPLEERRALLAQLPLKPPLRRVVELNPSVSESQMPSANELWPITSSRLNPLIARKLSLTSR